MIRVIVVDDQMVVCNGLKMLLDAHPGIEVIATAYDGAEAVAQIAKNPPDVVLMDLKMPVLNGIQATELIRRDHPNLPVVVLTTYDEDEWVVDAIRAGASGYLLKDSSTEDIIAAVEGVTVGETPISKTVAAKLFKYVQYGVPSRSALEERLTEREAAILRLLASGLSNADIAARLNLAEGTVRNHLTQIFAKLEVTDRSQATALAWRYGFVAQGNE